MAFIEGEVKEVSACVVVSVRGGAVIVREFLLKAGLSLVVSQVRSEDKMATDLQMATLLFYQIWQEIFVESSAIN
jgi:hypothetical protein